MRRKRFQRGSVKPRKRNGKNYWYAQWREEGLPKSKELGLVSKMTRIEAEQALAEILEPVNLQAGRPGLIVQGRRCRDRRRARTAHLRSSAWRSNIRPIPWFFT